MGVRMLHFDLSHLPGDRELSLQLARCSYRLQAHTVHTRASAATENRAVGLFPTERITHYAEQVHCPDDAVALALITTPSRRRGARLPHLVAMGIHVPQRAREAALTSRPTARAGIVDAAAIKLAAATGTVVPLSDEQLLDLDDIQGTIDAATSLVFHHPELLALHPDAAVDALKIVGTAVGLAPLALAIYDQARAHEQDSSQDSWAVETVSTNWQTGQQGSSQWSWSDNTLDFLAQPLSDAINRTKDAAELEGQCWTVLPGVTSVNPPKLSATSQTDRACRLTPRTQWQSSRSNSATLTRQSGPQPQSAKVHEVEEAARILRRARAARSSPAPNQGRLQDV